MRFLIAVLSLFSIATLLVASDREATAVPGAGGLVLFSVTTIDAAHDITPAIAAGGYACTSADLLAAPGTSPGPLCAPRPAPVPPGAPVPDSVGFAPFNFGLNPPPPAPHSAFTSDMNSISYGEVLNLDPIDNWSFSVDPAPVDGGATTGVPAGPPCAPPNVTSEAGMAQAQGDVFMTLGAPPGCNAQVIDEAALGLIAPTPPGVAPLDDLDALTEFPGPGGPCTLGTPAFPVGVPCAAFTVTAGSAILPAIPPPPGCGGPPTSAATILVPPGTPPIPPCLPGGCPGGGPPCAAISAPFLGLVPPDDIDGLCWWDGNGNGVPDLPQYMTPGMPGDYYVISLAPGSPSWPGPADILRPTGAGFIPVVLAPTIGLLPTDDIDALLCQVLDTDGDMVPNFVDNCPGVPNAGQMNVDGDTFGDACDTEGPPGNTNGTGGADDCTDGVDNDADGGTDGSDTGCDSDGDGIADASDNCPLWPNPSQAYPLQGIQPTAGDADCDGFPDPVAVPGRATETYIGTDPLVHCAATPGLNNDPLPDTNPMDFNDDRIYNGQDTGQFGGAGGGFNQPVSNGPFNGRPGARYDFNGNGLINAQDIGKYGGASGYFNEVCVTAGP